jgi:hypothetical protein
LDQDDNSRIGVEQFTSGCTLKTDPTALENAGSVECEKEIFSLSNATIRIKKPLAVMRRTRGNGDLGKDTCLYLLLLIFFDFYSFGGSGI